MLIAGLLVGGCTRAAAPSPVVETPPRPASGPGAGGGVEAAPAAAIPGIGGRTRDLIPEDATQAVVVTGEDRHSPFSTVVLYEWTAATGWQAVSDSWPAHNGLKGWTDEHWAGDKRSPIGVFGLTDSGGRLPDPGTRLPYHRSPLFNAPGRGFLGEPLAGSFDYVVAINYNRREGGSPLNDGVVQRPMGSERGGGVWFHVDHGGPTQACVSLDEEHMRELLRWLDPDREPVVVMGDVDALAR
ncbi:L,D-transpeptidase family protein [Streptomyces sp. NPDC019396]|uniref:L,D-transpeptidase family protein n=1 Tax=Streptomyces sp. NPDC019396 TaxID=3154687 RepID=UPI0033E3E8B3